MAEPARGRVEQVAARVGREGNVRHEHEQRQRGELVARQSIEEHDTGFDERRLRTEYQGEPADADDAERDADGHAEQQQGQQCQHTDESGFRRRNQDLFPR